MNWHLRTNLIPSKPASLIFSIYFLGPLLINLISIYTDSSYLLLKHSKKITLLLSPNLIKGTGFVILNRNDDINNIADILGDTNKFAALGNVKNFDNIALQGLGIQSKLLKFHKEDLIPKSESQYIRPVGSQRP